MHRPRTRLFHPTPLTPAAIVALDAARAHYLRSVLRMDIGEQVLLFNGTDGEWVAEILQLGKNGGTVTLFEQVRPPEIECGPWLLFAPLKGGRTESIVEKATELGVSLIQPVITRRSDVSRINRDRMHANAVEAAEQCERLSVPEIKDAVPLFTALANWEPKRVLFMAVEAGEALPAVTAITAHRGGEAAWLVGPEGGFDIAESTSLRELPFVVPIGLGPRILRADTAVFAALSLWQGLVGDWMQTENDCRPPFRV